MALAKKAARPSGMACPRGAGCGAARVPSWSAPPAHPPAVSRRAAIAALSFSACALAAAIIAPLPSARASDASGEAPSTASLPSAPYTRDIECLYQYPDFPSGCEAFSLAMVLRAEGFPASAADLVDIYLPTDPTWEDYVDRFAGDPRGQGGAMPPAMMACARSFLAANGDMLAGASGSARPVDLTGAGFDEVRGYVELGYPVMTWVTLDLTAPRFTGREVRGYRWYRNLHCVVLHGFDGGDAIVADPIAGSVRRDASGFREVFEACGAMAMTVLP